MQTAKGSVSPRRTRFSRPKSIKVEGENIFYLGSLTKYVFRKEKNVFRVSDGTDVYLMGQTWNVICVQKKCHTNWWGRLKDAKKG